ncbi:MAG: hypothetical protein IJW06_03905 [Clostridia bacterium]|nr:hypothetical protein [Clostridia bacterium]
MENTHTERESMVFYKSFFEAIEELPGEEFKKCACAIFNYGLRGIMPEASGFEKAILTLVKPQIDKNNQRWISSKKSHSTKEPQEPCEKPAPQETPQKEGVGEYGNVLLLPEEKDVLCKSLGKERYLDSVDYLTKYIKRKPGYKSASHFEDLRGWVQDALEKQNNKSPPKPKNPSFDFDFENLYENL